MRVMRVVGWMLATATWSFTIRAQTTIFESQDAQGKACVHFLRPGESHSSAIHLAYDVDLMTFANYLKEKPFEIGNLNVSRIILDGETLVIQSQIKPARKPIFSGWRSATGIIYPAYTFVPKPIPFIQKLNFADGKFNEQSIANNPMRLDFNPYIHDIRIWNTTSNPYPLMNMNNSVPGSTDRLWYTPENRGVYPAGSFNQRAKIDITDPSKATFIPIYSERVKAIILTGNYLYLLDKENNIRSVNIKKQKRLAGIPTDDTFDSVLLEESTLNFYLGYKGRFYPHKLTQIFNLLFLRPVENIRRSPESIIERNWRGKEFFADIFRINGIPYYAVYNMFNGRYVGKFLPHEKNSEKELLRGLKFLSTNPSSQWIVIGDKNALAVYRKSDESPVMIFKDPRKFANVVIGENDLFYVTANGHLVRIHFDDQKITKDQSCNPHIYEVTTDADLVEAALGIACGPRSHRATISNKNGQLTLYRLIEAADTFQWSDDLRDVTAKSAGYSSWNQLLRSLGY